ncbi:hypothetical protein C2G38_2066618 [Gigaspora rosea]|uniref:Uncharacterized protein n=1 Tax=Gigaspora rosea TaxID=44941 RepID=A0A397VXV3_9GLOM|nr:hypothetical protein C2G38_2066618 [Gigaspora rosea]
MCFGRKDLLLLSTYFSTVFSLNSLIKFLSVKYYIYAGQKQCCHPKVLVVKDWFTSMSLFFIIQTLALFFSDI